MKCFQKNIFIKFYRTVSRIEYYDIYILIDNKILEKGKKNFSKRNKILIHYFFIIRIISCLTIVSHYL